MKNRFEWSYAFYTKDRKHILINVCWLYRKLEVFYEGDLVFSTRSNEDK